MPQKKNPDAAELLRGEVGARRGRADDAHGVLHALPLAYAKDLQEDKEALFDAVDTVELCLEVAERHARRARRSTASAWPRRRPTRWSPRPTSPTSSSRKGMPFREAHGVVGGLVRSRGRVRAGSLSELEPGEVAEPTPSCSTTSTTRSCAQGAWLDSKLSAGGTAGPRVAEQLERRGGRSPP